MKSEKTPNRRGSFIVWSMAWAIVLWLGGGQLAWAQKKYDPNHPFVEALVRRAIGYLENSRTRAADDLLLSALCVIETSKRYENEIPQDHPLVRDAVDTILALIGSHQAGDKASVLHSAGIYVPCMGVIVLCEVNDQVYADQINYLLDVISRRQNGNGGFGYPSDLRISDTSQGQYVGLAFVVARNHGFLRDPEIAKRLLDCYCDTQRNDTWVYHYLDRVPQTNDQLERLSLHCAGLSCTYLLADVLKLRVKTKRGATAVAQGQAVAAQGGGELPASVTVYVKPKEGDAEDKDAPLVDYNTVRLNEVQGAAQRWLRDHYTVFPDRWPFYYMYGFERFAFFKEKNEGGLSDFPSWYDDGVDELAARQLNDGSWAVPEGAHGENIHQATGLAILFLVRSSQILFVEGRGGLVVGNPGLEPNKRYDMVNGQAQSSDLGKGIDDVVNLIRQAGTEQQLEELLPILGSAIKQLAEDGNKSKGEKMAFLRAMVSHEDNLRRLVAVKVLAGQQDLDNVPALLFALTDPDLEICREAHDGLRLVSRKVDAFPLSDNPEKPEFEELKKKWTAWYLRLRPNAELMD